MPKSIPESFDVELGGKTRYIKFGPSALRHAEIKGRIYTAEQMSNMTSALLAEWTWVSLLPDEPSIKEVTVLKWLADTDEFAVYQQVAKAVARYLRAQQDFTAAILPALEEITSGEETGEDAD